MDELKRRAQPKYLELLEYSERHHIELVKQNTLLEAQNELADTNIILLDRLCTLKEAQQESDDSFRKSWRSAKINDTRVSLWVLVLANMALYLDVIEINNEGTFITALLSLFGG